MFTPLGLLSKLPCPDHAKGECEASRAVCPFSHNIADKPKAERPAATSPTAAAAKGKVPTNSNISITPTKRSADDPRPAPTTTALGNRSGTSSHPTPSESRIKKAKNAYTASKLEKSGTMPAVAPAGTSRAASAVADNNWTVAAMKPPTIGFKQHPSSSSIPLSARQGGLKAFFNAFVVAYDPMLSSTNPAVAMCGQQMCHDDALEQELDLFKKANKASYKNSSVTFLVGLKKRDQETLKAAVERAEAIAQEHEGEADLRDLVLRCLREGCTETGTAAQVDAKRKAAEVRKNGKLDRRRLEEAGFVCPVEELERFEYTAKIPSEWEGQGGIKPDAIGETQECERCGKKFTVGGEMDETGIERMPQDPKECRYHWGKRRFEKVAGNKGRTQIWTCCGKQVGSSVLGEDSCCFGPHVFKETDGLDLHRREAFITTAQLLESVEMEKIQTEPLQIVAMDCELSYTTAGLSLTRLTLVDEEGGMILDELVRSKANIVDFNTRFSGITPEEYESKAVFTLDEVRKMMARFVDENTILLGHGLENDLRAIRLVHTKIVDTVMLFPHARGFPFRTSLRDLTAKYLGKLIQNGTSLGHSSLEDSQMSLELVRWKMVNDPSSPFAKVEAVQQDKPRDGVSASGPEPTSSTAASSARSDATTQPAASLFGSAFANDKARSVFRK